jgi:hypothetical protein
MNIDDIRDLFSESGKNRHRTALRKACPARPAAFVCGSLNSTTSV